MDQTTIRWFGKSWGAPVCKPEHKVETPKGQTCQWCSRKIGRFDKGVTIPFHSKEGKIRVPYHLDCFFYALGVIIK